MQQEQNPTLKTTADESKLEQLLALLSPEELANFWLSASLEAKKLSRASDECKQLSIAVAHAERGGKPFNKVIGLPRSIKLISTEVLERKIKQLKMRLVDCEEGYRTIAFSLCRWVQQEKRAPLLEVLHALQCPHDENGNLAGEIPTFTPDEGFQDLQSLLSTYENRCLALICGALILSDSWTNNRWANLETAFNAFHVSITTNAEIQNSKNLVKLLRPNRIITAELDKVESDKTAILFIRQTFVQLRSAIKEVLILIEREEQPNLEQVNGLEQIIARSFSEQSAAFGQEISSLQVLEAALTERETCEAQAVRKSLAVLVSRCRTVNHVNDPSFSGRADILRVCDELLCAIETKDCTPDPGALESVKALLQVVVEGNSLDDLQADTLRETIQVVFGRVVASAAIRGKLILNTGQQAALQAPFMTNTPLECGSVALEIDLSSSIVASIANSFLEPSGALPIKEEELEPLKGSSNLLPLDASHPIKLNVLSEPLAATIAVEYSVDSASLAADLQPEVESVLQRFLPFNGVYAESFWIDTSGNVAAAPWMQDSFPSLLITAATQAWARGTYALTHLFCLGVVACNAKSPFEVTDLSAVAALLQTPQQQIAGLDVGRSARLRTALENTADASQQFGIGLTLMLEALRPTFPYVLSDNEIDKLTDLAGFNDPAISTVVRWILKTWIGGGHPLNQMRDRVSAQPPEDLRILQNNLVKADANFRDIVANYWSAAGGRLQRTHCRNAWSRIVQSELVPLRNDFSGLSKAPRLDASQMAGRIRSRLDRLISNYTKVMDEAQVKFQDRVVSDSAMRSIAESLYQMADVLQRIAAQTIYARQNFDGYPDEDVGRVLNGRSSDPTDQLCARILNVALKGVLDGDNPMQLQAGLVALVPDLAKYMTEDVLRGIGQSESFPLDGISDVRVASALMLSLGNWANLSEKTDVLAVVREKAIENDRLDILSVLSATTILKPHEKTLLLRSALGVEESLFNEMRELERVWQICDELMVSSEPQLKIVLNEAREICELSSKSNALLNGRLVAKWLKDNLALANRTVNDSVESLVSLAHSKSPELGAQVEDNFARGDYRTAISMLHARPLSTSVSVPSIASRQTLWRLDAMARFTEPRRTLLTEFNGKSSDQQALVKAWVEGLPISGPKDPMPRLLYSVISGEANQAPRRGLVSLQELRDHRDRKTVIDCSTMRKYFQSAGLNPTFLPQLADWSKVVLIAAPSTVGRGAGALDDWALIVKAEPPGTLVAFLAPGLSAQLRDELSEGLRSRRHLAAVIDDVDLCRLCLAAEVAERSVFIAFMEVLLEQLDLQRVSPFSTQDGQHVRIETYVGRAHEAENLALRGQYTRLFSGRKLGKSALLKFIESRYNSYQLPSGNQLHVIFMTIAGGESEHWVVSCIVGEMERRFGKFEGSNSADQRPRDRLSAYMNNFLRSHEKESVLLILDEADTFVEGQLAEYDQQREASVSFCLLKELPGQVDANALPRVRVIFSGYRVTNTSDGVWAHAGDVLVLRPLQEVEQEAEQLITGTLARIGVDIGDHAPHITRRCGRQPAVLIRFGECLLRHLARAGFSQGRETIRISEAAVAAALTDQGVTEEIRTVVANNFQGNRAGQVIFGATLLCLKDLAPGHALTNGASQVLDKLREVDGNLNWLHSIDASPTAVVERHLQDFIDRELLTRTDSGRFGIQEYRLLFPHFLPVLTQAETEMQVRQQIRTLRESNTPRRLSRCALLGSMLEKVRYCFREPNTELCKLIVVGGHWLPALVDKKCGIADRLGCGPSQFVDEPEVDDLPRLISEGVRVFLNPAPVAWQELLTLPSDKPLVVVGSVAWLRMAFEHVLQGKAQPVEVIGQGRLPRETLRWWVEDARALHTQDDTAVDTLFELSGGIPLLVGALDKLIVGVPATELHPDIMCAARLAFNNNLNETVKVLTNETGPGSLTLREQQLLIMSCKVAKELDGEEFNLESEFQYYWENLYPDHHWSSPLSFPEDRIALLVLILSGLLPVADEGAVLGTKGLGYVQIDPNGPIARVAAVMESEIAA